MIDKKFVIGILIGLAAAIGSPEIFDYVATHEIAWESVGAVLAGVTAAYTAYQETRHKKMHGSLSGKKIETENQAPPFN